MAASATSHLGRPGVARRSRWHAARRESGMPNPTTANSLRPRLLDQVRAAIRLRHYSPKTEEASVSWIRRFILYHGKRHPREMGAAEVTAFLSDLAASRGSSASTQNQALSAVLFLYGVVLGQQLPWLDTIVRAQRPLRLPVVLSRAEVSALLARMAPGRPGGWLRRRGAGGRFALEVSDCGVRVGLAVGVSRDAPLCRHCDWREAAASSAGQARSWAAWKSLRQ